MSNNVRGVVSIAVFKIYWEIINMLKENYFISKIAIAITYANLPPLLGGDSN